MILEEVKIKNFKAFSGEISVKFETPFALLVGKNSSGKSSILDAINKAFWARQVDTISDEEKNDPFSDSKIEIKIEDYTKTITDKKVEGKILDGFVKVYKITSSKGIWEPATSLKTSSDSDPDFVYLFRRIGMYIPEKILSERLSTIFEKEIECSYEEKEVRIYVDGKKLKPSQLSAGMQAVLAIETILYFKKNAQRIILLIEEPENFLHPNLLRNYIRTLREISYEKKNELQIIITSHSKLVPSLLSPKEVIKIDNERAYTFNEEMEDWQYIVDENKADIFFADRVIFFEGITDKAIFSGLLNSAGAYPEYYNTSLIHIEGVYHKEKIEKLCKAFNVNCVFVLDKDAKEKGKEKNFENKIFLENGEIEDSIPAEDWAKITFKFFKEGNIKVPLWFLLNIFEVGSKFERFSYAVTKTFHNRKLSYAVKLQKLYESSEPNEEHPLYKIVDELKAFIEYGDIKTDIEQKKYNPVEILKKASCIYLLEENTLSNPEIFVNELNNEEEGTFCFVFNDKCYKELNEVIEKFLKETIPFYCIVGNKWDYERAKKRFNIDFYVEKEEENLLTLMSNGVRSFIVKPQRTLSEEDLEPLMKCERVL